MAIDFHTNLDRKDSVIVVVFSPICLWSLELKLLDENINREFESLHTGTIRLPLLRTELDHLSPHNQSVQQLQAVTIIRFSFIYQNHEQLSKHIDNVCKYIF